MAEKSNYFVLRAKAVPEVLLKVVEAKRLLDSGKLESVQEATDAVGISRSSFYKYKDDIFPFYEGRKGKTVNLVIQMDDEQGILSVVLKSVADAKANILTIHQSVPVMVLRHSRYLWMYFRSRMMWMIWQSRLSP